jgi:hypothetical protein
MKKKSPHYDLAEIKAQHVVQKHEHSRRPSGASLVRGAAVPRTDWHYIAGGGHTQRSNAEGPSLPAAFAVADQTLAQHCSYVK